MTITVLSDIHGRIEKIERLSDHLTGSDLVLLTGDITHFGREPEAKEIITKIAALQSNILAITGNCDYPEVEYFLSREGISLHQKSAIFGGIGFVGTGGSLPCPGKTPNEYEEEEMQAFLDTGYFSLYTTIPFVLVVHHPPFNTFTDMLPSGVHVGSVSIQKCIKAYRPLACFCGHIHEARGKDSLGGTVIINPGPFKDGNYALVKIFDNQVDDVKLLSV
jgi:Icc-related predicted phosphoesterase